MKQASLVRREHARRAALKAEILTQAANVVHVALTDAMGTRPYELHRGALERLVDARVDARIAHSRWYRRAWRAVRRGVEYLGWRAAYDAR